jgi:hypothetical protein
MASTPISIAALALEPAERMQAYADDRDVVHAASVSQL